ncbi:MAG: hypothetical protein J0M35_10745 [Candidatus Obscuribacter phosphatis]|uniref:Uncharacterized protein n=1 Tax=Candidatus Obscuribacter phosphatis TaxID=1906157 RepID=A0A8J7TLP1_9BACT|nr:hypothetical protein [Candidatus Obscuribacter phosphatis]
MRKRGSAMVMSIAVTVFLLVPLGIMALTFVRLMGSHHEQTSAIEAAALKVAQDLNKIVVEDPDLGYIGLSDYGPLGSATLAPDNFSLPVKSINTLTGTVRLDMIISDLLKDETMIALAEEDYKLLQPARQRLEAALKAAILPGGKGYDLDGNEIKPYDDAIAAYNSNQIRMNGGNSTLLVGSMKISLGVAEGLTTSTPIPQPPQYANLNKDMQEGGYYKAYIDIPYKNHSFVFAANSDNTCLIDPKDYKDDLPNLSYYLPSVVRCQAIQQMEFSGLGGNKETTQMSAAACAQPGAAPQLDLPKGSLAVTFPSGAVPDLSTLLMVLNNESIAKSPTDRTVSPKTGDYTPTALDRFSPRVLNFDHAPFGQLERLAFYDWIRRSGVAINIDSLFQGLNKPLSSQSTPHSNLFTIDKSGLTTLQILDVDADDTLCVSHNQWYAVSGQAFKASTKLLYDVYLRDFVYQPGKTKGGQHGGEPLPIVPGSGKPMASLATGLDENATSVISFAHGPGGGAKRPIYSQKSVAVEIRFRQR